MFRYKSGVDVTYNRQGYIYFTSRLYKELLKEDQQKIVDLCLECGGPYHQALLEFVTTDASATELEMKHSLSRRTLYRVVKKYYEAFPAKL